MSRRTAASTTAASKRRWNDHDWDVVMEAQSYVAVFADASAGDSQDDNSPAPTKTTKKNSSKKRKTQATKSNKKKMTTPVATTETVLVAPTPATEPTADGASDVFWLAQLQDDVTESMLDLDASVRVTWLNRVPGDAERRYELAYDDRIDVQTILCHVYVVEHRASGQLELTAKSAARVHKCVRRTRGELSAEEEAEESEGETPPVAPRPRKQRLAKYDDDDDDDTGSSRKRQGGGRRVLRANAPKKISKRIAAMHIPPHYAQVDASNYDDRELLGTHEFDASNGDLLSSNREVMRAVRTQNYELLKTLMEDKPTLNKLYSFRAYQSADVKTTALQYAIRADDAKAVTMLLQAHKITTMGRQPSVALPSHSTGSHTSAYSDYNRREINASRGGREGNNALLADCDLTCSESETAALWNHPSASVKMLTVLYPAGEWANDYSNAEYVARVVRVGNIVLASKMVEVLGKNGGWGYNDLHVVSLSTTDQPLPIFRSVSVVKKAQQTKITPLHFAAINPNVKYLEALWENGGSEESGIRDDAQFEPIHYAAVNESPCAVRFLLERRANLLSRTKEKHTPLMRALIARREETAIAMLEHVATEPEDISKQVLTSRGPESYQLIHFAAENNCLTVLKHLLGMGVDINALAAGQTTALSIAARLGHFDCVKLLLDHGAKIDRADKLKKTPLLLAVKNGHTRIAAYLINQGANVNAYDTSENSVAHYAASYGWMSCLQLLIDAGADLWSRNSWGFVPLICAMLKQRTVCADCILKSDSEQRFMDFRDRTGRTMLYLQCELSTNLAQIEYLLGKGLDPNIGNCDDRKPLVLLLDRARYASSEDVSSFYLGAIRALVAHGAEVNYTAVDEGGNTTYPPQPLQLAIRHNLCDIFDFLLLEGGADPCIVESGGTDAWLTSISRGAQGAYFLEKLMAKYPTPRAFPSTSYRGNIFHTIASSSSNVIPVELVEKMLTYCENAQELMHEKNSAGVTPLMALFEAYPTPVRSPTTAQLEHQKLQEEAFCKIARLFASRINDVEALKKYVSIRKAINPELPSTEPDNIVMIDVLESTILHTAVARASCDSTPSNVSSSGFGVEPVAPRGFSFGSTTSTSTGNGAFGTFGTSAFGASPFGATSSAFGSPVTSGGFGAPSGAGFSFGSPTGGFGSSSQSARAKKNTKQHSRTSFGSASGPTDVTPASPKSPAATTTTSQNIVKLLLEICPMVKSLVNIPTRSSRDTPLLKSVEKNDKTTAQLLLSAGADVNFSPFKCAACADEASPLCTTCPRRVLTDSPLLKAVRRGQVRMVQLLLESGADSNFSSFHCVKCSSVDLAPCAVCATPSLKDTPLLEAVSRGHVKIATLLLEAGASTDCCASNTLDSPLHITMKAGKVEQTKLLLSHGASMVKLNAAQSTPLAAAISAGLSVLQTKPHEGEIQFSTTPLGRGCKPPATLRSINPVMHKMATLFSQAGATVVDIALSCEEAVPAILAADENKRTSLHHAAAKRDLPLLTALLARLGSEKAAYVNKPDIFGRTALHFALNSVSMAPDASFDVERFLFLAGASASAVDNFGLSPLHFALRKIRMDWHLGYESTLGDKRVQEQKAAGVYEANKAAAFTRHLNETPSSPADPVETVSNLIAAGCDPFALDSMGRSPLHLAASIGAFVCVSTLLSACPKSSHPQVLEHQDVDGFTALGRAFEHGRETTITTLIQSGAQVSGTVKILGAERSYFSVAVEKRMSGICHMLLNAGFCRRQAVEDAVCGNQLQLAKNLMIGLEISNDRARLVDGNSRGETLLHCLTKVSSSFTDLAAELAWTLVDDGLDVAAVDQYGNTVLHYAAAKSNMSLMDFLFHHGSDVNARNKAGNSPLMHALAGCYGDSRISIMQYMLLHPDLDLHTCDKEGFDLPALFVKYFLDAFENDSTLMEWFELALRRRGDSSTMYSAMTAAEDIFENSKLGISSKTQAPLLVWVSYAKSVATRSRLLRVLLQHGASPSSTDSNGNTVLVHLVARNMLKEVSLVLQECQPDQIKSLLDTANHLGQTPLHLAVEPFEYGSYENVKMVEVLVDHGADLYTKDANGATPLDYVTRQASRFVFRFLKDCFPKLVKMSEEEAFDDVMDVDEWNDKPDFESDAEAYLKECEAEGKISKTRVAPDVDENCDVGEINSVYGMIDSAGNVIEGEEYNALLTKVDVKHGKHGINVFYRTQVVHDELQSIYLVFTNWGRIGEEGKFQNTPFHSADEAVTEFKKIFKSKTGNAWEDRRSFEKRVGKYNLVQRIDYSTEIARDVTESFTEHLQYLKRQKLDVATAFAPLTREELADKNVMNALFAITDVRNLQLAARECQYQEDLPLARDDEIRNAMAMLHDLRSVVEEQAEVRNEMAAVRGNLASEDATTQLSELSDRFAALVEDLSERSSRYYEIVARNEDRTGSAISAFDNVTAVDQELNRLKRLLEVTHTYKMLLGAKLHQKQIHPMEYVVDSLQIQLARVPTDNDECVMLTKYFTSGIRPGDRSNYRVSSVFEVTRRGEAQRLQSRLQADPALAQRHTTLLWHGTNRTNLMGILSEGLRIAPPEAAHHGYSYGKGLYFADVAAKSLGYCHSPYTIHEEVDVLEGEVVTRKTKSRRVQYMLLCEVALGNQRDARSTSMYTCEQLAQDGFHSVRAVGRHMPNPKQSLVSPSCGAKVPLGRVGQLGRDFECPSAWAVGSARANNSDYSFPNWQSQAETYLDQVLATKSNWTVGDTVPVSGAANKALFARRGWYENVEEDATVAIRVREVNASLDSWDVGVEFVVTPPRAESEGTSASVLPVVVGKARRYLNVNFSKPPQLPKDFALTEPSPTGHYSEHIVYSTDQVRLRYLVEVELR